MSKINKALEKLKSKPKDFSWKEATKVITHFGYVKLKAGKTGGARIKFFHEEKDSLINIHRPHNPEILKEYQLDDIIKKLREAGFIE